MDEPSWCVQAHGAFRHTVRSGTLEEFRFCVYTLNPAEAASHVSVRARLMACTFCANMMCADIRSVCQQFCVSCTAVCAA